MLVVRHQLDPVGLGEAFSTELLETHESTDRKSSSLLPDSTSPTLRPNPMNIGSGCALVDRAVVVGRQPISRIATGTDYVLLR